MRCKRPNSYSQGVFQTWSKLYYGEGGVEHLSTRGRNTEPRILREGLYVTMFAGLQEPEQYFTPQMIKQGLMRRLIVSFVEKSDRYMDPINQERENMVLDDTIATLKERRELLRDGYEIVIRFDNNATEAINSYARCSAEAVDEHPNNYTLFAQSDWEQLMKLATLRAIDEPMPDTSVLIVNKSHIEAVKPLVDKIYADIKPKIEQLGVESGSSKSRKTDFERVLNVIRKKSYATRSDIYGSLKWSPADTESILSAMITAELIEMKQVQYGRSRVFYAYYEKNNMPRFVEENIREEVMESTDVI
jgi:hypothetical protein